MSGPYFFANILGVTGGENLKRFLSFSRTLYVYERVRLKITSTELDIV